MSRANEQGQIVVHTPDGRYCLRLAEWERLEHALDHGQVWFTGDDNFGITVRLRLDNVESVLRYPAGVIAEMDDDPDDGKSEWQESSS